jgi:hypothetical protein
VADEHAHSGPLSSHMLSLPWHRSPCLPVAYGRPTVEDEEERGNATMLTREEDAVDRACVDFTQR